MWSDTDSEDSIDPLDNILASLAENKDLSNYDFNDILDDFNQNMPFFENIILPESEVSTNQTEISDLIKRTVVLNLLKENYLKKFLKYMTELQKKLRNYIKKLTEESKNNYNNNVDNDISDFDFEDFNYDGYNIKNNIIKRNIEDLSDECKSNADNKFNCTIYNFGIPYFKDESNHSYRKNIERIRMDENGIIMPFYFNKPPLWQQANFIQLKRAVLTFMPFKKNKNHNDIAVWSSYNPEEHDKLIDWDKISDQVFKNHFKSTECESLWKIYVNPTLNKSNWTSDEKEKLLEIAELHSYQNWKVIANNLGTNRSGYQCFLFYVQKLKLFFREEHFTIEEDKKLLDLIKKSQLGSFISWPKVFYYFNTRSRLQLFFRYTQTLHKLYENTSNRENFEINSPEDSLSTLRKKRKFTTTRQAFTTNEDFLLIKLIEKHGPKSWTMFAKEHFDDKRTADQLRHRYNFLIGRYSKKTRRSTQDRIVMKKYVEEIHRKEPIPNGNQIVIPENLDICRAVKRGRKPGKLKNENRLDKQLVAFFNGNFTFVGRPRKWVANDYLKSIITALQFFNIKTLNLSSNEENKQELSLDDEIIEILQKQGHHQYQEVDNNEKKNLAMPLNISNLVGLRYMLRQTKFGISTKPELPESLINSIAFQRFKDRFKRLFFLAAISSIAWEDPDLSNECDQKSPKKMKNIES